MTQFSAEEAGVHRDDPSRGFIAILAKLADAAGPDGMTLAEIVDRLDERAAALLILALTLPCLVPGLPGAQIIAIGILLVAVQVAAGREEPWLPRWFLALRVKREWLVALAAFAAKRLVWTERISRPRLSPLACGLGERVAAIVAALAAVTVMLPITNTIPSTGLLFIAVGLLQRDGAFVAIGEAIALAWIALLAGLSVAAFLGAGFALDLIRDVAPWALPGAGG